MIKGLIFDLDNCIFDTTSMGTRLIDPVIMVMDNLDPDSFSAEKKKKIEKDLWTNSLEDVISANGIPEKTAAAMRSAYINLEVPDSSRAYDDVEYLDKISIKKILVTSGYMKFQQGKIEKTGIGRFFREIIIDAVDDTSNIKGKKKIFEEIMEKEKWGASEVIVLGDNPDSELKTGRNLGMITVQTLRPGIKKVDGFDHYIEKLDEFGSILGAYNGKP